MASENNLEDIIKLLESRIEVKDLVECYKHFLSENHPEHIKRFTERFQNKPENIRSEAVVFSFLKENTDDVKLEEDLEKGGVDFRCKTDSTEFVVEVTGLKSESVTRASGLPNEIPKTGSGGFYSMITPLLRQKASQKASQMSGYDKCPRVLTITSDHPHASTVLDCRAASDLLTGETSIAIPCTDLITLLKDSVFFRLKNGKLKSCRQSISAILLFTISGASAFVVGLLHPDPANKFPPELLSLVPFIVVKEWPPENGRIRTEWKNQETQELKPYRFWYDERFREIQQTDN